MTRKLQTLHVGNFKALADTASAGPMPQTGSDPVTNFPNSP